MDSDFLHTFRDLWRLPEYVKDANNEPNYLELLTEKMREMPKPPLKVSCWLSLMSIQLEVYN